MNESVLKTHFSEENFTKDVEEGKDETVIYSNWKLRKKARVGLRFNVRTYSQWYNT